MVSSLCLHQRTRLRRNSRTSLLTRTRFGCKNSTQADIWKIEYRSRERKKPLSSHPSRWEPGRRHWGHVPQIHIHRQHPVLNVQFPEDPDHLFHQMASSLPPLPHVLMIHSVSHPGSHLQLVHILYILHNDKWIWVPVILPILNVTAPLGEEIILVLPITRGYKKTEHDDKKEISQELETFEKRNEEYRMLLYGVE
uniref:Uncharacterized protein n=1 Tax=Nymphaea colorata TaxID=210225 RepID=A0A5K1GH67_9MAGN